MSNEPILQPFEMDLHDRAVSAARARRLKAFGQWLRDLPRHASNEAHALRGSARRALFEMGALARSSATLAGLARDGRQLRGTISRDASRVGHAVKARADLRSATLTGLRTDLAAAGFRLRKSANAAGQALSQVALKVERATSRAGRATRNSLGRSSTVTGLAIDSKRVVRRVKETRRARKLRPAH